MKNNKIGHSGTIEKIEGDILFVKIEISSACASCHARGACGVLDSKEKIIEVDAKGENFAVGDVVEVVLDEYLGYQALILGYVVPFFVVLISLVCFTVVGFEELLAGVYSLVLLIPYYLILYSQKDRLKKKFVFKISDRCY